jgi:hypothetical protein
MKGSRPLPPGVGSLDLELLRTEQTHWDFTPLDRSAPLLSEGAAIARARGGRVAAPASALMMRYGDIGGSARDFEDNAVVNPDRPAWIITVHGDAQPTTLMGTDPGTVHVYSMVIDAESGIVSDWCYGCDLMSELGHAGTTSSGS